MIAAMVADIVTAHRLNLSAKSKEHLAAMFIILIALQRGRLVLPPSGLAKLAMEGIWIEMGMDEHASKILPPIGCRSALFDIMWAKPL